MSKIYTSFSDDCKNYEQSQPLETIYKDGAFAIELLTLHKQTDRQSYKVKWYIVSENGEYRGSWKSKSNALRQVDRLKNPRRLGRPPQDKPTVEHIMKVLRDRPEVREFMEAIIDCTHAELQTLTTALKIAKEYGTESATEWLKENWPPPFM